MARETIELHRETAADAIASSMPYARGCAGLKSEARRVGLHELFSYSTTPMLRRRRFTCVPPFEQIRQRPHFAGLPYQLDLEPKRAAGKI
jgi:hypothetical protein